MSCEFTKDSSHLVLPVTCGKALPIETGSSCSQAERLQPVPYAGNAAVLEQRISWLPTEMRSLDIALRACQGCFVTSLFPSHYSAALHSCITVQTAAHVQLHLFSSLSSPSEWYRNLYHNCNLERADLLPKCLEEMLERVTLAGVLRTQDSLSMKYAWGELQVMDEAQAGRGCALFCPFSQLS